MVFISVRCVGVKSGILLDELMDSGIDGCVIFSGCGSSSMSWEKVLRTEALKGFCDVSGHG